MASLVLLTTRSLSRLANDLTLAGYRVFAALEVAEVLHRSHSVKNLGHPEYPSLSPISAH